jgi:hypothetical protein
VTPIPTETEESLPTEDRLIALDVAVGTWWQRDSGRHVPAHPGPVPRSSDAELLTLAAVGLPAAPLRPLVLAHDLAVADVADVLLAHYAATAIGD